MKARFVAATFILVLALSVADNAVADAGIRQETVQFARGASFADIKGQIKGDATVDYVVRAAAGQTLSVKLRKSNAQNYFNVMPPASQGSAMFVGDNGENYSGVLPADGDYTVRVYLMRPAARRGAARPAITRSPLASADRRSRRLQRPVTH
ncbi:MAG: DNA breaking-rejoining protein [Proteobacteria bacterium]|nr:DNA breaking-rejoining protein [Pseudomonadota bacterium]